MAQVTKFTIDPNLSGIQLRTQASEMLTALSTLNSGDLEPVNPTGGMLWLDTTKNILKIRDKTNTAWLDFASVNDKVLAVNAASATDSLKLGGIAADKYALKDDIPSAATETKAGIVKLKNSITGSLSDTAVSENAVKEYVGKNASIGIAQSWQDVTAQRQIGITYTNTTGRPIALAITLQAQTSGGSADVKFSIGGKIVFQQYVAGANSSPALGVFWILLPGDTYSLTAQSSGNIIKWLELR
nr:MAG TPA: hypothetical protein [Caudoviricetes sp.]